MKPTTKLGSKWTCDVVEMEVGEQKNDSSIIVKLVLSGLLSFPYNPLNNGFVNWHWTSLFVLVLINMAS